MIEFVKQGHRYQHQEQEEEQQHHQQMVGPLEEGEGISVKKVCPAVERVMDQEDGMDRETIQLRARD